jgi:hypothetical protein
VVVDSSLLAKTRARLVARLRQVQGAGGADPLTRFRSGVAQRQQQQPAGPPEPPTLAGDEITGPPDYVGVAAQKSGTTWWHQMLLDHPQIVGCRGERPELGRTVEKELHFFQQHWDREFDEELISAYHRYFPRRPGQLTGEWTPRYAVDPWTPARLAAAAPAARVLLMLRDPIDRFRSGVTHNVARFGPLHPRMLVEQFERGRYASHLDRLRRHFPEEQILVLQFERCVQRPREELRRTYRFLGVDPDHTPPTVSERIFGTRAPHVQLPSDLLVQLQRDYEEDVRALASRCENIDLSLWPSFAYLSSG